MPPVGEFAPESLAEALETRAAHELLVEDNFHASGVMMQRDNGAPKAARHARHRKGHHAVAEQRPCLQDAH